MSNKHPPWLIAPRLHRFSQAWSMGGYYELRSDFEIFFRKLTPIDREAFKRKYPEPIWWLDYYLYLEESPNSYREVGFAFDKIVERNRSIFMDMLNEVRIFRDRGDLIKARSFLWDLKYSGVRPSKLFKELFSELCE